MPTLKSWISPKTQKGLPSRIHGLGFFAKAPVKKGELVSAKAGHIIDRQTLLQNLAAVHDSEMQIAEDLFISPLTDEEEQASMVYVNHSCEPNLGIQGQIFTVAMRDIEAGEELTIDYAMHLDDSIIEFDCNCQSPSCRKRFSGQDWKNPELQAKYRGYFAWFLEQKIKALSN